MKVFIWCLVPIAVILPGRHHPMFYLIHYVKGKVNRFILECSIGKSPLISTDPGLWPRHRKCQTCDWLCFTLVTLAADRNALLPLAITDHRVGQNPGCIDGTTSPPNDHMSEVFPAFSPTLMDVGMSYMVITDKYLLPEHLILCRWHTIFLLLQSYTLSTDSKCIYICSRTFYVPIPR